MHPHPPVRLVSQGLRAEVLERLASEAHSSTALRVISQLDLTTLKKMEPRVNIYIMVLSKVMFYLLQDGCSCNMLQQGGQVARSGGGQGRRPGSLLGQALGSAVIDWVEAPKNRI